MIVPVHSDKYPALFAAANNILRLSGTANEIDNLHDYYAHMKQFYGLGREGYRFVMMPLVDAGEAPFIVDLNKRAIIVPEALSKIGAVQSDQMAELIVFEVDRFFDYMDLANTNIYVQWQLPDEEKTTGATQITMIDLEGGKENGKLRFAWPLHSSITAHAGVVKFSVRFFLLNGQGELVYSLNTVDANLVVKGALDPKIAPDSVESVGSLFDAAIIDSQYSSSGVTPPIAPVFGAPGLEMDIENEADFVRFLTDANGKEAKRTKVAKLGNDNELKLRVQAVAPDSGTIQYSWMYKPDTEDATWRAVDATLGTVSTVVEEAVLPTDANKNKYLSTSEKYYTDAAGSALYEGTTVPNSGKLYEKFSQLYIKGTAGKTVTGWYAVDAVNVFNPGQEDKEVKSPINRSALCYLPGPQKITFKTPEFTLSKDAANKKVVTPMIEQDINEPTMTYTWYRSEKSSADALKFASGSVHDVTANGFTPGWYAVKATAALNLATRNEESTTAQKVCAAPAINAVNPKDGKVAFPVTAGQIAELTAVPDITRPASLTANADRTLYADLTYTWYYRTSNSTRWYKVEDYQISETDTSKIVAKIVSDNTKSVLHARNIDDGNPYHYYCEVTNTLNGESVTVAQDKDNAFLVF